MPKGKKSKTTPAKDRSRRLASHEADRPDQPDADGASPFPIVGIGASAGGLAAFEAFFRGMPADVDPNMAFVLVQHLAPDHKSILVDLLKQYTRMPVYEVEDGMSVCQNCVYIIPPNRDMMILHGRLILTEPAEAHGLRLPIDTFFRSLAQDQQQRAIGIVLSGTGSDGTLGLKEIKGAGGVVMAQEPTSSEYAGMPQSAIATGIMDAVLPPGEMPDRILSLRSYAHAPIVAEPPAAKPSAAASLDKILALLRARTGHDFSRYKQNTVERRVQRRMAVHQIAGLPEYIRYLQENKQEATALFHDLLIGVTNFFRDTEAFAALQEKVIPCLFKDKQAGQPIRVWVPGCSTGEEGYSIAMLLQEYMDVHKAVHPVQIFGSDIDPRAIAIARCGEYPVGIAADVSPDRLARFFVHSQDEGIYTIQKSIRDMLVFAEQDVNADPPFSRLDLISCRNLLIYLGSGLQKKLLPVFHYALLPGGHLFLGNSETVGDLLDLFSTVDRKWKIYQRRGHLDTSSCIPQENMAMPSRRESEPISPSKGGRKNPAANMREIAEREMLHQFAPPSVLVNERGDVLYIHGRTGNYLELAPGAPTRNILLMAREGLKRGLTTAIRRAATQGIPVHSPGLQVKTNGDFTSVDVTVSPADPGLFLVTFKDTPPSEQPSGKTIPADATAQVDLTDAHVTALEKELQDKEEYLQATVEELETSNEELKSTNEELQSANEEMQSSNEELETSKEELQSVNEELATVNAELQQKVEALSQANNDMNNLLAGTGIGTIFVGGDLRITRFTPAATAIINLIPGDVGRPVGHIVSNLIGYDSLVEDLQAVLDSLVPREQHVETKDGKSYLMRLRPYRTMENVIDGAVITFVDISEQHRLQALAQEGEAEKRLAAVVRDSCDAIILHALDGRILAWNPMAEKCYGWTDAEACTMNIEKILHESDRESYLTDIIARARDKSFPPVQVTRIHKNGQTVDVMMTSTVLIDDNQQPYAIATTERPIPDAEDM